MTAQHERSLQSEILYRLNRYPVVAVPVPNGLYIPSHNESERVVVARLMARMKSDGMLVPGAPDLILMGERRAVCVELKRSASRDLFGRKPRGRLSPEQRSFRDRCIDTGVDYLVASAWEDVQCVLPELY